MPDAEFTGERVIPGQVDADLFNEHLSRYALARRFADGKRVLDLGCGTGYGAALLAEVAENVTAVDLDPAAVEYAREHYGRPNVTFEQRDVTRPTSSQFGVITAFEVIEHLEDWRGLLEAARQQLAPGGLFLVSTPNKSFYAEARGEAGGNPFHTHEFEYSEFARALADVFPHVAMMVQNHSAGLLFAPISGSSGLEVAAPDDTPDAGSAHFYLGVCSAEPLPPVGSFFWIPRSANLLRERDRHVALLRGEVQAKTGWLEDSRRESAARNGEYAELLRLHRQLQEELEARSHWAKEQDGRIREQEKRIEDLQAEVEHGQAEFGRVVAAYEQRTAELEQTYVTTVAWAQGLEQRMAAESEERSRQLADAIELLDTAERTVTERTLWAQGLDRELRDWQERYNVLRRCSWVRAGSVLRLVSDRQ